MPTPSTSGLTYLQWLISQAMNAPYTPTPAATPVPTGTAQYPAFPQQMFTQIANQPISMGQQVSVPTTGPVEPGLGMPGGSIEPDILPGTQFTPSPTPTATPTPIFTPAMTPIDPASFEVEPSVIPSTQVTPPPIPTITPGYQAVVSPDIGPNFTSVLPDTTPSPTPSPTPFTTGGIPPNPFTADNTGLWLDPYGNPYPVVPTTDVPPAGTGVDLGAPPDIGPGLAAPTLGGNVPDFSGAGIAFPGFDPIAGFTPAATPAGTPTDTSNVTSGAPSVQGTGLSPEQLNYINSLVQTGTNIPISNTGIPVGGIPIGANMPDWLFNTAVPNSPFLGGMAPPVNWGLQVGVSGTPGLNIGAAPGEGDIYWDIHHGGSGIETYHPPWWMRGLPSNATLQQIQAAWVAAGSPGAGGSGGGKGPKSL